ncbi:MAG TPA: YIP1 family protein [Haliangiales bacterium]|nr:YIP1 family protein [Haliangiales bacterium]
MTELDEVEGPPSFGQRLRRIAAIPVRMLGALLLPDRTMPGVVADARFAAPLLFVVACGLFSAWMVGRRLDMSFLMNMHPAPGAQQQQGGQGGQGGGGGTPEMSDRELDEMMQKEKAKAQVMLGLDAGVLTPIKILLAALGILAVGRYVGGKTSAKGALAAASYGALPFGVKSLLVAAAASSHASLTPMMLPALLPFAYVGPAGPGPLKLLAIDPFLVWAFVIIGFGLAAASHMSRRKVIVTLLVCFCLYQLLSGGAAPEMPGPGGPMMMRGPQS